MNQITRTPEPPQPRVETQRAPRGEELQQASSQFAELLAKGHKEAKAPKSPLEKAETDDKSGECVDAEGRTDRGDALPYGIRLPEERGQGSEHSQHFDQSQDSQYPQPDQQQQQQQQQQQRFVEAVEPAGDECKPVNTTNTQTEMADVARLLGPPTRVVDPDPRFESLIQTDSNVGGRDAHVQELPTPGDLLLQAFAVTRIETPLVVKTESTAPAAPTPQAGFDAIRELGEQIAERILITRTETAGPQEMLIQLKDSAVAGTEVRMTHNGERLQVTLVTDNASSFHLLAARQADLQTKLGDAVVVQLSFDPEGMISQQRTERPIAAESSHYSGDRNRERDADDRRRDQRRNQQQDPES